MFSETRLHLNTSTDEDFMGVLKESSISSKHCIKKKKKKKKIVEFQIKIFSILHMVSFSSLQ